MNRREFLRLFAAINAVVASADAETLTNVGVQLVSVPLQQAPEPCIASLRDIGFRQVEAWFPSAGGPDARTLRSLLDKYGLTASSRHWSSVDVVPENVETILRECEVLGNRNLICAALPVEQRGKLDSYKRAAAWFNELGARTRERGIQFGVHSQPFDFPPLEGVVPFDYLLASTDPVLVKFQLDIGNLTKAAVDPVHYLVRQPHRFVSLHLKDIDANG